MPAPTRELLMQLLSPARLQGPELDEAVARAIDADYWRRLVPDFHVGAKDAPLEFAALDENAIDDAARAQLSDGYFRLPGVIAAAGVRRINDAIDALTGEGWPAAFVFVYDEAWQCGRSPATRRLAEAVLGPRYRQISHVWPHVVKPVAGATGWAPHVDGDPGGRLSLWMALTPATVETGCMHVIPRNATSAFPGLVPRFREKASEFSRIEVASLLHATHALEAAPGDALGWGFDIIHWGGYVRRAGAERRGFSFEFIAADQPSSSYDAALIEMDALPGFDDRVRIIAKSIDSYRKFEPRIDRFADVATAITKRLSQ